nr:MAG TPA: hypothetical protein [Caudoviricetes sp.]
MCRILLSWIKYDVLEIPIFQRFLRKEGDSNPRFPLGEYTLSRCEAFRYNYLNTN